jgi:hypothetical protein
MPQEGGWPGAGGNQRLVRLFMLLLMKQALSANILMRWARVRPCGKGGFEQPLGKRSERRSRLGRKCPLRVKNEAKKYHKGITCGARSLHGVQEHFGVSQARLPQAEF